MSFQQALRERVPPRAVGDIVLRYEGPLLVGERRAERLALMSLPEALSLAAICAGLIAFAVVVLGGPALLSAAFALSFAALLFASTRLKARQRVRRRFALNFADETLRVNGEPSLLHAAAVTVVDFDAVTDVVLTPENTLEAELKSTRRLVLVKGAEPNDEDAQTLRRILRDAFGVRPPPPAR